MAEIGDEVAAARALPCLADRLLGVASSERWEAAQHSLRIQQYPGSGSGTPLGVPG